MERLVPLPLCSELAGANAGKDIAHARGVAECAQSQNEMVAVYFMLSCDYIYRYTYF